MKGWKKVQYDWIIKKVRPSGSTCGQVPGKDQMCSGMFEGNSEGFELCSESSEEFRHRDDMIGLNFVRTLWLQCGEWVGDWSQSGYRANNYEA